jgi:hypothetical protein
MSEICFKKEARIAVIRNLPTNSEALVLIPSATKIHG